LQTDFATGLKSFTTNVHEILAQQYPDITITDREMECLFYATGGRTAKEIAQQLDLSPRTVEHYLDNLKSKFDCTSKTELRNKLVPGGIWL
jgi:DNA-binding CsgD family transcriptional regulator